MAQKPGGSKFSPLRMSERFQKTMLVAVGVALMIIFAVPLSGPCTREREGERSRGDAVALIEGQRITYGEMMDMKLWTSRTFGMPLSDGQALLRLAQLREGERAGVYVSDIEVADAVYAHVFPRRARIEYAVADLTSFGKKVAVKAGEIEEYYAQKVQEETRAYESGKKAAGQLPFLTSDGSPRPIGEVRGEITKAIQAQKAVVLGKQALRELAKRVDALEGPARQTAFRSLAGSHGLLHAETLLFSAREAFMQLRDLRDAPGVTDLVFKQPIGEPSEPLPIPGGVGMFRVVQRTRGYDPDGTYHPEDEAWVSEGYGVTGKKTELELLRDRNLTAAQLQKTVRDDLAILTVPSLVLTAAVELPEATFRDRYLRDNTRATAAYFVLRTADFADGVQYTEDELRAFYDQYKGVERAEGRIGYLIPPRVQIEYVLGRKKDAEATIDPRKVTEFFEHHRSQFKGRTLEETAPLIRARLADAELHRLLGEIAGTAFRRAGQSPNLDLPEALTLLEKRLPKGAFVCQKTELFSAQEAEAAVPELRGAKLADVLFGERGEQYAVAGGMPERGKHPISESFSCDEGRFFFRVLERKGSTEVPYESRSPATGKQLIQDLVTHKGFAQAREKAREYRQKLSQAAFERFAELVGAKPAQVEMAQDGTPTPPLDPEPSGERRTLYKQLYDRLALAEIGDLSDLVPVGPRFLLARLASREQAKGLQLQVVLCGADPPKAPFEPAVFELEARYNADPYPCLEPPKAIPFEGVEGDIRKLLTRRRARALAAERLDAALAELGNLRPPDLAALAAKHKIAAQRGVKVDLAKTEATPQVGKAQGFREAVTGLKVGESSGPLASADGRFAFVLNARADKSATLDVLAAAYDAVAADVKLDAKDVRKHYDDHRDVAYMTNDEITPAPPWKELTKETAERVRKAVRDEWAKKAPLARLAHLRNSLLLEAFRTVPDQTPLGIPRRVTLAVQSPEPFPAAKPPDIFDHEPEFLKAILALKPGEVSAPVAVKDGAAIAFLAARKADEALTVDIAAVSSKDVALLRTLPSPEEIKKYYDENKDRFRVPDQLRVRYIAVSYGDLMKDISIEEADLRREYDRSVKAGEALYRDTKKEGAFRPFAEVKDEVRRTLLMARARDEAEQRLTRAKEAAVAQGAAADFRAIADKQEHLFSRLSPFFARDQKTVDPVGRAPELAAQAFAAKEGQVLGPFLGSDGACILKRHEFRAAHVPPIEEAEPRVVAELRLEGAGPRALEAAGKLREKVLAAMAKAPKPRDAFRKAVEDQPLLVQLKTPLAVILAAPLFPVDAGPARKSVITGLGSKPELTRAIFRLRPSQLSPVVVEPDQSACYVAVLTHLLLPPEPTERHLIEPRFRLTQVTHRAMEESLDRYFKELIGPPK